MPVTVNTTMAITVVQCTIRTGKSQTNSVTLAVAPLLAPYLETCTGVSMGVSIMLTTSTAPSRAQPSPYKARTFTYSCPLGSSTCTAQARQGSKECTVRRISTGRVGSATGVPMSAAS